MDMLCDLFINSTFSLCVLYPHKDKSMTQAVQNNEGKLYEIKEIIRFIFFANYFIFFSLKLFNIFLKFCIQQQNSYEKPTKWDSIPYNFQILKPEIDI